MEFIIEDDLTRERILSEQGSNARANGARIRSGEVSSLHMPAGAPPTMKALPRELGQEGKIVIFREPAPFAAFLFYTALCGIFITGVVVLASRD